MLIRSLIKYGAGYRFNIKTIYAIAPLYTKATLRKQLYGLLSKNLIERVSRGVYETTQGMIDKFDVIDEWQWYQLSIKVVDTHMPSPTNKWTLDVQASITGRMRKLGDQPREITPTREKSIDYGILMPRLSQWAANALDAMNVHVPNEFLEWKWAGTQRIDEYYEQYDPYWTAEVSMTNPKYGHRTYEDAGAIHIPQELLDGVQ